MKTSSLSLLILLASCSLIDPELPLGRPRAFERYVPGTHIQGQEAHQVQDKDDTLFYVSAVSFPSSYDWRRDTAFGATACTLKLYRGKERLLSVVAGPSNRISSAPDRHHIINGSLYTDYADYKGTSVKCNGKEIANWKEAEILQGLLLKDGTLHTLGRGLSSKSFTYRRNGSPVLKIDGGELFGGFQTDTYGPTGAIYEDGGSLCFAYKTVQNGMKAAYLVKDGEPELLMSKPGAEYIDIKQMDGGTALYYKENKKAIYTYNGTGINLNPNGNRVWDSGEVLMFKGLPSVVGGFHYMNDGSTGFGIGAHYTIMHLRGGSDYCYFDLAKGTVQSFDRTRAGWEKYYFLNHNCASLLGNDLAAVLTPRNGPGNPFLAFRGDTTYYKLHGFLSGLAVEINTH